MRKDSIEAELKRLHRHKQRAPMPSLALGPEMLGFFKHSVQKRQNKLSGICEAISQLIPQPLLEHCALDSFQAGTLKIIVDSSSHLYELKQLLLAGLQQQILIACRSAGLRKITLKMGRWYEGTGAGKRITF